MKKYLFIALGAVALTSCSSDEVVELNEGNEIKFSVVADNDSRAVAVWCNKYKPTEFNVWANSGGHAFMAGDLYKVNNGVYTSDVVRYWPESAGVDFYALKYDGNVTYDSGAQPSIINYNPSLTVAQQQDIIYATTPGAKKEDATNGVVKLNFRHALSQIEFMAMNNNPTIKVVVKDVCVGNAVTNGTFTLPELTTDGSYVDATHGTTGTLPATFNQGTWDLAAKTYANYTVEVQNPDVALTATASSLTLSTGTTTLGANHGVTDDAQSMMLIPSSTAPTTAWDPATANLEEGSYLGINVVISNIVTVGETTYETEIYKGWAYVPVVFAWDQGKRYVYTFNFAAGKDGGYKEDGTPVLTDINLDVTVDDFIWGGNTGTSMETVTE